MKTQDDLSLQLEIVSDEPDAADPFYLHEVGQTVAAALRREHYQVQPAYTGVRAGGTQFDIQPPRDSSEILFGDIPFPSHPSPSIHETQVLGTAPVDSYTHYEAGLEALLSALQESDHPRYDDGLVYEQRLRENITQSRLYGDTPIRKSDRAQIVDHLNELSRSTLQESFNALCARFSPVPPPSDASGGWLSSFLDLARPVVSLLFKERGSSGGHSSQEQNPIKVTIEVDGASLTIEASDVDQASRLIDRFWSTHPQVAAQVSPESEVKVTGRVG